MLATLNAGKMVISYKWIQIKDWHQTKGGKKQGDRKGTEDSTLCMIKKGNK